MLLMLSTHHAVRNNQIERADYGKPLLALKIGHKTRLHDGLVLLICFKEKETQLQRENYRKQSIFIEKNGFSIFPLNN